MDIGTFQSSLYVLSVIDMFFWDNGCFWCITIESGSFLYMNTVSLSAFYFFILRTCEESPCFFNEVME